MNKFSGIDLHSNDRVVVVSDEADRIVYQRLQLPTTPWFSVNLIYQDYYRRDEKSDQP